jgi:predicted RNase H-like HicB family nuclease
LLDRRFQVVVGRGVASEHGQTMQGSFAALRRLPYHAGMDLRFTAVFKEVQGGYIGFVEELPGANTQGATLEEARSNLAEAVALVLEANRQLAEEEIGDAVVIREPVKISA